MARVVRWSSDERVDQPDMQVGDFLVLGEFRRFARGVLLGPGTSTRYPNLLIRGFKVEPEGVPSANVVVTLDPGGSDPFSFAFGAENVETRIDHGTLMGGDGMDGLTEGNAQSTLSFTGQPPDTYTVQMRLVMTEGASDNRIFWNEATDTEFVDNTETRFVPAIELRLSGAASDEWIDLATVEWDGATIEAGDIIDIREFAFEGSFPFSRTTQDGAGGVGDFPRDLTRADDGLNEVYPALRALARQIQDIKGPSLVGDYNWFERPAGLLDPAGDLPVEKTKHLRSIDTVTYTVGDGLTMVGDFNGTTGLVDAIDHLIGMGADLPSRVEIVVHSGQTTQTWDGPRTITVPGSSYFQLTIRAGVGHLGGSVPSVPLVEVEGLSTGEYALTIDGTLGPAFPSGRLRLEDMSFRYETGAATDGQGLFDCVVSSIQVSRCNLQMTATGSTVPVGSGCAVRCDSARESWIKHSTIQGPVRMHDALTATSTTDFDVAANSGGMIADCVFLDARLSLRSVIDDQGRVNGFAIRDSRFICRVGDPYTGQTGLVEGRGARRPLIEHCTFEYGPNIDCLQFHAGTPVGVVVQDCSFNDKIATGTNHTAGSGTGSSSGTGWAVNLSNAIDSLVDHCNFFLSDVVDAGGIRVDNTGLIGIRNCNFRDLAETGSGTATGIQLTGGSVQVSIADCKFNTFGGGTTIYGIHVHQADEVTISGVMMDGSGPAFASGYGGIVIAECDHIVLSDCQLHDFRSGVNGANNAIVLEGPCFDVQVDDCKFRNNGGYCLVKGASTADLVSISDCNVYSTEPTTFESGGFDCRGITNLRVTDNSFAFASTQNAIIFDQNDTVIVGNHAPGMKIRKGTAGALTGLRGYMAGHGDDGTVADPNLCDEYTTA